MMTCRFSVGLFLCVTTAWKAGSAERLNVVATTADLAALAGVVGGKLVATSSIAKGSQNPHYVEAKPSFMRRVNRADLLIYNGMELEIGWLPLLIQGGRNHRVVFGAEGLLDASLGIDALERPTEELNRSMGDIHPEGNPHYLLDPQNGLLAARSIAKRLTQLRPDSKNVFLSNLARFERELQERSATWELTVENGIPKVVAYHKQWEYLANWLGFEIVGYVETKPGIPPNPKHISELGRRMRDNDTRVVIYANYFKPKAALRLAESTGTTAVPLPAAVGSEPGIENYFDLFDTIVERLNDGLVGPK